MNIILPFICRHKFVFPDQESVALIISKVQPEDIGTYKVTLSNDLGEASTQGKLTLSGAPQFTEKIEDQKTGKRIILFLRVRNMFVK